MIDDQYARQLISDSPNNAVCFDRWPFDKSYITGGTVGAYHNHPTLLNILALGGHVRSEMTANTEKIAGSRITKARMDLFDGR
ncbi:hypothetical protein SDC9_117113 [bioreactor metagenome]|uniref:Uncharacterized protein n=1 Tax=bioreactor metagenome TaxID=1076179 RepID=A0A645BXE8_9ZZZZ